MASLLQRMRQSELIALPIRNRNYRMFEGAGTLSLVGIWMQRLGLGWLIWELTHSGPWLLTIGFAELVPVLLFGPFTGAFADRLHPLRILRITQIIYLVQAILLCVLSATDLITIWLLLIHAVVHGTVIAFNMPARLAFSPTLVVRADLPAAVAIHATLFNSARFIAPLLGGLAIQSIGVPATFMVNALSYVIYLWVLYTLQPTTPITRKADRGAFFEDFKFGISYAANHLAIAPLLVMLMALGVGMRPVEDLLPGLAGAIFNSDASGFSYMAAGLGGGAIIANLWLGNRARSAGLANIVMGGAAIGGLGAILLAVAPSLQFGIAAIALFGFGTSCCTTSLQTVIQITTERAMLGRVMGLYSLVYRGAPALGAAAGAGLAVLGLRVPIAIGGAVIIGGAIYLFRKRPAITTALQPRADVQISPREPAAAKDATPQGPVPPPAG